MEYRAVAEALTMMPDRAHVRVFSDNLALVENLTRKLESWRKNGFANTDATIVASLRRIDAAITEKSLVVRWQWVRGHNGNAGNERADALAAQGAREAKESLRG
jgi:ribonuclease HI